MLEVNAINKLSTVVKLTYKDPNPQKAEKILNQVIKAYNQKAVNDRNNLAENTLRFIEQRMNNVEKELNNLEIEIQEFRSSQGVVDISEQGKLYLENVGDYDRQIADINRQISVLRKVEKYVISKKNRGGLVPSTIGINDPVLSQLLEKLYNSEIEYEKLKKTTGANNPILLSITNEINKIRPSILENIRSHKSNLNASLGNLSLNSDKSNSELKNLPEKERALLAISRKKAIKNELFVFLQQKREETALSYAPNEGDSRIVDFAQTSPSPVSPKKSIFYIMALVAAFGLGLAFIIGKEMLNSKILFRTEIENHTSIPVISELPYVYYEKNKNVKKTFEDFSKEKIKFVINKLSFGKLLNEPSVEEVAKQPGEAILPDHFRQLGVELGLYDKEFSKQKILVTSSIPGEGKSYVSANLALSIALTGKKTALVDMDLRKEGVSGIFNLENKPGISNMLTSELSPESIKHKEEGDLYIFPSGEKSLNSSELLTNEKLVQFFTGLKQEFDAIIIDYGWQTLDGARGYAYTGDWNPDRIDDMPKFVDGLHDMGTDVLLWYSVPFVGKHAKNYERFKGKYLYEWESQGTFVLDPRYPEVREFIITTYEKALIDWKLDGFKFDFLGFFRPGKDTKLTKEDGRDYASVDFAVDDLMTQVMARLRNIDPEIMIEFRQPYIGPLMRKYGNMFRASDCPNMAVINRVRTANVRLLAGKSAVHADPIIWNNEDPVEVAALQILNPFFAVPQISVKLKLLPGNHKKMLAFWMHYWKSNRKTLLDEGFFPKDPEALFPTISAGSNEKMITAIYNDIFVEHNYEESPKNIDIINVRKNSNVMILNSKNYGSYNYKIYDCMGQIAESGTTNLKKGAQHFKVPPSGLLSFERK